MITETDIIIDKLYPLVEDELWKLHKQNATLEDAKSVLINGYNFSDFFAEKCIQIFIENNVINQGGSNDKQPKKTNGHEHRVLLGNLN